MVMSLPKLLCICCFAGIVLTAPTSPNNFRREISSFQITINNSCNDAKHLPCWNEPVRKIHFKEDCNQTYYQNIFRQIKANLNQTTCKTIFSKAVIAPVLLGNTSVPHSFSQSPATTLKVFCTKVQYYVGYLKNECSNQL